MKTTTSIVAFAIFLVILGKGETIGRVDGTAAGVCGKNIEAVVTSWLPMLALRNPMMFQCLAIAAIS